ncbi:MAG: membrane lipoprotein lipid attachment site-containing protein [Rikenellaceae bacterium]|nr:membrane lipoprotein lipid attachment site-containing protein [Rikenellaceae bacterium]
MKKVLLLLCAMAVVTACSSEKELTDDAVVQETEARNDVNVRVNAVLNVANDTGRSVNFVANFDPFWFIFPNGGGVTEPETLAMWPPNLEFYQRLEADERQSYVMYNNFGYFFGGISVSYIKIPIIDIVDFEGPQNHRTAVTATVTDGNTGNILGEESRYSIGAMYNQTLIVYLTGGSNRLNITIDILIF